MSKPFATEAAPKLHYSSYEIDQPDKYLRILRAKIRNLESVATNDVERRKAKRAHASSKSKFRFFRQQSLLPESIGTILPEEHYRIIWSFLPSRFQVGNAHILYSTSVEGISIQRFLEKIQVAPATIIVINTICGAVFGAFCSESWANRFQCGKGTSFFGTGETFLFTCKPRSTIYPWIGLTGKAIASDQRIPSFFMSASPHSICIGGGNGNAISFFSDLSSGCTGTCSTFENPPLVESQTFTTGVIEVYGVWQ